MNGDGGLQTTLLRSRGFFIFAETNVTMIVKKKNYRIRSEYSMKYRVLKRILHSVFSFILLYQGMYVFYETRFHFENSSAPTRKK